MTRFAPDNLKKGLQQLRAARSPKLPIESLGAMIACNLLLDTDTFTLQDVENFALSRLDSAPEDVRKILHTEANVCGQSLKELGSLVDGILASGIAGRYFNEDRFCRTAERSILLSRINYFDDRYPEVMRWLRT